MTRTQYRTLFRALGVVGLVGLAGKLVTDARGDSAVQFMTAKSLPDATVAVIDPESGTSSGTEGQDVNLAVGDIILFKFTVASAPDGGMRGIQAYITEYVPPNTEVVGVRIIDADDRTLPPRRAGLALDGCSGGAMCNSDGSIAQMLADTGIFYSTDPFTEPVPDDRFLTLRNGILMDPEPRGIDPSVVQLLNDTSGTYYAHNLWDWDQVRAFGTQTSPFANGQGNTPHLYGSPVAGPDTHYALEATRSGSTVVLDGVEGPWQRIYYPGSQIGVGGPRGATNTMTRVGVDTVLGFDVTPATPVPATAVRWALGEAHVGELRFVEVALRVTGLPIDPTFGTAGGNVDCGEAIGTDISSKSANTGGANNSWVEYVGHPQCVFLRLKLDLEVDKSLAGVGSSLNYRLEGSNLSVSPETNARVRVKYVESDQDFSSASPPPDATFTCPGETNKTCLQWNLGTLAPGDDFNIDITLGVQGQGGGTNVVVAQYLSNELTALDPNGYQTTALTVVQPTAAPRITLTNALDVTAAFAGYGSNNWVVNGTLVNAGTTNWTSSDITLVLPVGWGIFQNQITVGGVTVNCSVSGTLRICPRADTYAPLQSRALSFRVVVPATPATPRIERLGIRTRGSQSVFGSFETEFHNALEIPVGAVRTQRPVLDCPISSTAPQITGTSEALAAIDVLFNLIERGDGVASAAGAWTVSNYLPGFGEMYGGLEVTAVATAPGELPSERSDECFVAATRACSDGFDNDGDGLIDFPADPGCASPSDNNEEDPPLPQCSDGIDNNGAGGIDWPADPSCSGPNDPTEDGVPACSDGVDNDGDGLIDFPADPDCTSANDGTEVFYRQCQDGIDNDGDGLIDFPDDPGCHSAFDDDEFDSGASTLETRARLLIALDSSGSMNWNTCDDVFTGGDGSTECAGTDVACATCATGFCGNGDADDSRLFQVKSGLANVVAAFGEVEYALMRFHQRAMEFDCPGPQAGRQAGGWQGGGAAPCDGGFAAGDLLVSFGHDNEATILDWINHDSDYDGVAPIGTDFEVRGSGTTPLAGILNSANDYLDEVRTIVNDPKVACRPYRVILVTDGAETCGGSPTDAAAALLADGVLVNVIGFSTPDPTVIANLNAIALAGGTGAAIFVDDEEELSARIAEIIEESILVETCNGLDDDCDTLVDEDFPEVGPPAETCDNGELGECHAEGVYVCSANGLGTVCNAPAGNPVDEICNGLDDDCDGLIDEDTPPGCACVPLPEICNGVDDDCDGEIDEGTLPGVGQDCGINIGVCEFGALACVSGSLVCQGGTLPGTEVCNLADDDCDTFVDEVVSECYEFATGCTPRPTGGFDCAGICQSGVRGCTPLGTDGECLGDVGPEIELCNGVDDDCDGEVDEGFDLGAACDNGLDGVCFAPGVIVCNAIGGTECTAPILLPGIETCDGTDEDCDGEVDEELGAPIGNPCGGGGCTAGEFACVDGQLECVGEQTGTAEICNGDDDDCDLIIDEDVPGTGGDCVPEGFEQYGDTGRCAFGHLECEGGGLICRDYQGPIAEIPCNGIDEDCDGEDDQTCPGTNQACIEGGCRNPCQPGEFPCPFGQVCEEQPDGERYCMPDLCAKANCPPGFGCDPDTGACFDLCEDVTCNDPLRCVNGICQDCFVYGCDAGFRCVRSATTNRGECVFDPCFDAACEDGEYCVPRDGSCQQGTCADACGNGEICQDGECIDYPCGRLCPDDRPFCNQDTGQCLADRCTGVRCDDGEVCNPYDGACIVDPCPECPDGMFCVIQSDESAVCQSRLRTPTFEVFAGGGGCGCRADDGGSSGVATLAMIALAIGLALGGRRRRLARARPRSSSDVPRG
jgi:MYXO-CTERM domain-containing protein